MRDIHQSEKGMEKKNTNGYIHIKEKKVVVVMVVKERKKKEEE